MKPSEFYDNLLKSLTTETEQKVFKALSYRIGRMVTRAELREIVFGLRPGEQDLASESHDRTIRKCIENMRNRAIPIVSTSSESGYELSDDPDRIKQYMAEERSRIDHIQDKLTHLQHSMTVATALREWRAEVGVPVQERLF